MKTMEFNGKLIAVNNASENFSGYGHYRIDTEILYKGLSKTFYEITSNGEMVELICSKMSDNHIANDECFMMLFNLIKNKIEKDVMDWCNGVDMNSSKSLNTVSNQL